MKRFKTFFRNAVIGGVIVMLPLTILGMLFHWLFKMVTDLLQPVTDVITAHVAVPEFVGDLMVIGLILLTCFLVGSITATSLGRYLHQQFDERLKRLPGYQMVKDIINQLFGDKSNSPFKSGAVARVRVFGEQSPTAVTAIVTSRFDNGDFTVFVPTGPNPTTGFIFHVPEHLVELRPDIKVDAAFRTIIACGAGSNKLFAGEAPDLPEQQAEPNERTYA